MYPTKVCLKSYVKLLDHLKSSVLHGKHTNYVNISLAVKLLLLENGSSFSFRKLFNIHFDSGNFDKDIITVLINLRKGLR